MFDRRYGEGERKGAKMFEQRWRSKEAACDEGDSGMTFIPCGSTVLPGEAAGLLFYRDRTQVPLWNVSGARAKWPPADQERLASYWVIGWVEGVGDVLCIEQPTGVVWRLHHWDRFQTRQFVNTSVGQLAECLLAQLAENQAERFRKTVRAIDLAALGEQSFWSQHAAALEADAGPGAAVDGNGV